MHTADAAVNAEIPPDWTWERIRAELETVRHPYPRAAVEAARAKRSDLTPLFLELLQQWSADPSPLKGYGFFLHLHVIGLLAEWREQRAYAPLIALLRRPEEEADELFGDDLGSFFDQALASVCGGDLQPLLSVIGDQSVSVWVRACACSALTIYAFEADTDAMLVRGHLLAAGKAQAEYARGNPDASDASMMLALIVCEMTELGGYNQDELALVRNWFDSELVDESIVDWSFTTTTASKPTAAQRTKRVQHRSVRDSIQLFSGWYCFSKEYAAEQERSSQGANSIGELLEPIDLLEGVELDRYRPSVPTIRTAPKIGRNDPCPCGSGKKFKKCCAAFNP